jgi:hypothetical protein
METGKKRAKWSFIIVSLIVLLISNICGASITVYTNRSAWENAVGNTFEEEFFTDTILNPGVSVVTNYGYIDVYNGCGWWWDYVEYERTTTWIFDDAIIGYGGNWNLLDPIVYGFQLYLDGVPVSPEIPYDTYSGEFFGVISTVPFNQVLIIYNHSCGKHYTMGNMVYAYTGEHTPIPNPTLAKVDNIPNGNCVGPGDDVNYSIYYAANGYGDTNVKIIDFLPDEVDYNPSDPCASDPCGVYDPVSHTVTWDINFPPDACGCIELVVQVNMMASSGGIIANHCEIKGDRVDIDEYEGTPACCWMEIPIVYVDADADGNNNGTSWENAYNYLQDALLAARNCGCNEIRVAQGIYRPDEDATHPDGNNSRYATFQLINGVEIKGGYAGFGKPDPNARNIEQYETIFSGDLLGNDCQRVEPYNLLYDTLRCDLLINPFRADNSYHVVTGSDTNSSAILDGFTITGGNARGSNSYGGGMYNYYGSPMVTNCIFIGNSAISVSGDSACGGGMYNYYSSPIVTNCTFIGNAAISGGSHGSGGGMHNENSSPKVRNCIFSKNIADNYCAYIGPNAFGGGMCNFDVSSRPAVINCIFVGNMAFCGAGGGINCTSGGDADVTNCILRGNIVLDNMTSQISGCSATYSNIQGEGYAGEGNIDADPMFAVDGYHLTLCSLCIDAGTNTPPGGGLPEYDIDGEPRIMDSDCNGNAIIDMGVDEYYLIDCSATLRAHCPGPDCRAVDIPRDVVLLRWTAGRYAADVNGHRVYLDANEYKAINRNGCDINGVSTTEPCYPIPSPPAPLAPDQTYYWAVDEVNDVCEPHLWRGDVWHFRVTGDYFVVDDFNRVYGSSPNRLRDTWKDYYTQSAPITRAQVDDVADPNHDGPRAMKYWYRNHLSPYYSEARATIGTGSGKLNIEPDWLSMGAKALVLWFYGKAGNDKNEQMYVKLIDGASVVGRANYPDMNAVQEALWHEWNIDLQDFADQGVNLSNVAKIYIGFGDQPAGINDGIDDIVYFDSIRLYKRRCRTDLVAGDVDGDCRVGRRDLKIMTDKWLEIGCCEDLYKDDKVNFNDYAILADSWLVEGLWPYEE